MKMSPEIKICGITREQEIEVLNREQVAYAGFVLWEKSKRYVTIERAKELLRKLDPKISSVAVMVSPDMELIRAVEDAGFSRIQIHGVLSEEIKEQAGMPIWQAVNISDRSDAENCLKEAKADKRISGYVVDAASYGSGKTFAWESFTDADMELLDQLKKKQFVLAGGLNEENVAEGIRRFDPDVVDVSSGVEGSNGKDAGKIHQFVACVRKNSR
ncbi:MAG: phosphoribosylanthranilate isomerase [Lachnospiraceae bacterium]|nr:phosphoribosylanthranilate isomerase [Lachnospiraceae bacterium]